MTVDILQATIDDALSYAKTRSIDAADASISKECGFSVSARKSVLEAGKHTAH